MKEKLLQTLKQYFGYSSFRPLQFEIISELIAGRDALAILPTGAGKSLCFQLPALVRPEISVVVSPLIALMKDQVDGLSAIGVEATFLNSSISPAESASRKRGLLAGQFRILYVAPERLVMPDFMVLMSKLRVGLIAIDEAHCISAWGHDFRPEYRKLSSIRESFPNIPILALTATATARVREDIATQLGLATARSFSSTFNRPNLFYSVVRKTDSKRQILNFVRARGGESGIVYCFSRDAAEKVTRYLSDNDVKALVYHAGLTREERLRNQEAFARDEVNVICATVAFGMGIDKPNVRFVIHHDLPRNLESYYQETGRAGRDGLQSQCLLLYGPQDGRKIEYFINQMEGQEKTIARRQLQQIEDFARQRYCRRKFLLSYFGETLGGHNCDGCDNCSESYRIVDAVEEFAEPVRRKKRVNVGGDYNQPLFEALRALRKQLAQERGVPAFMIFGDRTLQGMARLQPGSIEQMREVYGVGDSKLAQYGETFLGAIRKWKGGYTDPMPVEAVPLEPVIVRRTVTPASGKSDVTIEMYLAGHSVDEIASRRSLTTGTVVQHIAKRVAEGESLDISKLLPAELESKILEVAQQLTFEQLRPLKDALGDSVSYEQLHLCRAKAIAAQKLS